MSSPFVYAMVHQSDHALSENKLKCLLCYIVLFMFRLPLTVSKVCKRMFYKKNMTLYITNDLPIIKKFNTYIHHPTKWGYIRKMKTKYITSSSQA